MFHIDTLSLSMSCKRYMQAQNVFGHKKTVIDWNYAGYMNRKITAKLRLKDDYSGWFGKYNGYSFWYNPKWNYLTIKLAHDEIRPYYSYQIGHNVIQILLQYFELEQDDLNEIKLNRLDIHCDFKYQNEIELKVIKNILSKATDSVYTYRKKILKDDDDGFILVYKATKKGNTDITTITVKNTVIEDKWGELENENY